MGKKMKMIFRHIFWTYFWHRWRVNQFFYLKVCFIFLFKIETLVGEEGKEVQQREPIVFSFWQRELRLERREKQCLVTSLNREAGSEVWVLNSDRWWFISTLFFVSLSQSPTIHFRSNTIGDWNVYGWLFCGWVVGFSHSIVVVSVDIV